MTSRSEVPSSDANKPKMSIPHPTTRRSKRPLSSLSCPSSPSSDSDDDDLEPPHKKLAQSLNRLSLSATPIPESTRADTEMKSRKSYEKDSFTTVIESLSTTTSDTEAPDEKEIEAPFPRDEARVTILSEIERRLTQFPPNLFSMNSSPDNALVLYRSPESMGLPKLERQKQEDMKIAIRKRIAERRKLESLKVDGYEADAEDFEDSPLLNRANGFGNEMRDNNEEEEEEEGDGEMMDLD